jgi:hypothetical protein
MKKKLTLITAGLASIFILGSAQAACYVHNFPNGRSVSCHHRVHRICYRNGYCSYRYGRDHWHRRHYHPRHHYYRYGVNYNAPGFSIHTW